ncbi:molybdopterin-dependent oxidoreductase [Rhodobacteraceae bacterium NNCM2]|nr:molybdopterin-dependent oxidoreductase [Coraliihabitans acroporae]
MIRRVPHCAHWGAFNLLVEDDKIVGVEPFERNPNPSPIIHAVPDWLDEDVRIAQPMVREGWLRDREKSDGSMRGKERMVPVSWDEANKLVAGEVKRVASQYGNASIFGGSYGWTSAGRFHHAAGQMQRLLNLAGGHTGHRDTYSVAAGAVLLRHVLGTNDEYQGHAVHIADVAENADHVLVIGALTLRTSQQEAGGLARHMLETHLRKLAERGVKVTLVSPRKDDVPDWLNADWLAINPGTDVALLLGMAGEIVAKGAHDADFLARCCTGADAFLGYLTGAADGTPKNADWAAGITGLPAETIRALAADMTTLRSFIAMSWSLQRAVHGEQPFWAAIALAAVAGQMGKPGGGVSFGFGSLGGVGTTSVAGGAPGMPPVPNPIDSFIPVARITELLENPGGTFTYEGEERTYPDTRMVWWSGGNPYHHHQDLHRLERAWAKPETIVVQEPLWTATARRADILLPATTSIERNDIAGNRRSCHILAMKQAVQPLGQSRTDYDICRGVAAELGLEEAFSQGRDEMDWIRAIYARSVEQARERTGAELPDFETFWETGHAELPLNPLKTHLAEFRKDPEAHPLSTPSGKITLYSEMLADRGYSDCPPHPAWLEPPEWLGAEGAERHPFHLISAQPPSKLHSQIAFSPKTADDLEGGRGALTLNPADAAELDLSPGDTALVWNERGKCLAGVRLSETVRPRVALLPTGAWFAPEETPEGVIENSGNPNALTLDRGSSAFSGGCSAHTCLVAIKRYEGNLAPPPKHRGPH